VKIAIERLCIEIKRGVYFIGADAASRRGAVIEAAVGFRNVEIVALGDVAVGTFALIHRSVRPSADWHGAPVDRIEEWKILSERYLVAFISGSWAISGSSRSRHRSGLDCA
jgi:hypothetical protein